MAIVIEEATEAVAAPEGIDVEVEFASDVAAQGDRVLLRQVLIGLLTNAFKNTEPPGKVSVGARARAVGRGDDRVHDSGSGISPDEVDRIFERFYRGSGSLEQEGFGLGLSIATPNGRRDGR